MQHQHSVDASAFFAGPLGAELRAKLNTQENVLGLAPVDLTSDLRFGSGLVALTSERVLALDPASKQWREWVLAPDLCVRFYDHGGIGNLELHDNTQRLGLWRTTLANQTAVLATDYALKKKHEELHE